MKNKPGIIITLLVIIALVAYMVFEPKKVAVSEIAVVNQNTEQGLKEFKNDTLGVSFNYPAVCGEIAIAPTGPDKGTTFQAAPTHEDTCPFNYIFAASREASDDYGEECGFPAPFEDKEANYKNKNGINMVIINGGGETCVPVDGDISALINLKRVFPVVQIVGPASPKFTELLETIKIY